MEAAAPLGAGDTTLLVALHGNGSVALHCWWRQCCTPYITHFSLIIYANDNIDVNVCYLRLGHIGQQRMDRLAKEGFLGHLERVSLPTCENYLKGKMIRKPFGTGTRSEFSL
jgi:GAG-pre-integrase domain